MGDARGKDVETNSAVEVAAAGSSSSVSGCGSSIDGASPVPAKAPGGPPPRHDAEGSPYRSPAEVGERHLAATRIDPATGLPICSTGELRCGLRYWIKDRAAWLRLPEELVAEEPHSFEDPGSVQIAKQTQTGFIREISEGEAEDLEDCLDAIQRPFPLLRRSIPLSQAVQYAEALWED
mmetsp:Transcript_66795/g.157307  ORF Transcript_66795/g.157307 Transcript_66795/m.157307 type:complete len:179 (+) Transcript_66795:284-820(+)